MNYVALVWKMRDAEIARYVESARCGRPVVRFALVTLETFRRGFPSPRHMWRRAERRCYHVTRSDRMGLGVVLVMVMSFILGCGLLFLQRMIEFSNGGAYWQTRAFTELSARLMDTAALTNETATIATIHAVRFWMNDTRSSLWQRSACNVLRKLGDDVDCAVPRLETCGLVFGTVFLATLAIVCIAVRSFDWMERRLVHLSVLDTESQRLEEWEARLAYPQAFRTALLSLTPLPADTVGIVGQYHCNAKTKVNELFADMSDDKQLAAAAAYRE
jgi:hypothetical protein